MKFEGSDPAEYLTWIPNEKREKVHQIRQLILEAAPKARERIHYGMLYYELNGGYFASLAAQKNYVSLYLCDHPEVAKFKDRLPGLNMGKCCLRFSKTKEVPAEVLFELLDAIYQKSKSE